MRGVLLALIGLAMTPAVLMAQVQSTVVWRVSTDNGTSWQTGNVSVAQSQTSVLVQAQSIVTVGGVPVPSVIGNQPLFAAANFEAYSTTTAANNDAISDILQFTLVNFGELRPGPLTQRRVGNILAVDRINDNFPLGTLPGIGIVNVANGLSGPTFANPLAMLQYRLQLDGSLGERSLSGLFMNGTVGGGITFGRSQALIQTGSTWSAFDIVQTTASVTVIPAPTVFAMLGCGSLLALRRRR